MYIDRGCILDYEYAIYSHHHQQQQSLLMVARDTEIGTANTAATTTAATAHCLAWYYACSLDFRTSALVYLSVEANRGNSFGEFYNLRSIGLLDRGWFVKRPETPT